MKDLVPILPGYDEKLGTMNAKIMASRDAEAANYAHYMACMLQLSEVQREENKKIAEIRKERHGIDPTAQQPSTLAIMARAKEDDEKHWLRHLPEGVQIKDQDGNININERMITYEEASHIESIRRRPKNSTGQSEENGSSPENRQRAADALICSPGIRFSDLSMEDQQRLTQMIPYSEPIPIPKPEPKVSKKDHWFQGGYTILNNWLYRLRNRK